MANRILRRHAKLLGYTADYTIFDQDDARRLARNCVEELGLKDKHFPKPDVLLGLFSLAHNSDKTILEVAEDRFAFHDVSAEAVERVGVLYQQKKRDLNAMDFDDLLINAWVLFEQHPEVMEQYREQFLHVLVDEYQDTNPVQARLVDALAARHRNILVVGDDFQSIYSWRGADYRNILDFPKKYPGAQVYKLETNYRSVPEVLHVANACIAGNPEQFQKTLRAVRSASRRPSVVRLQDGREQAHFIIQTVRKLEQEGVSIRDMIVLYRSHFHAMELQMELARAHMPYTITSGMRFFEQAHIKDVLTVLRLIHNPCDEISFSRLLCLLPKVGAKTAIKIWNSLGGRFNPSLSDVRAKVYEKLPAAAKDYWPPISQLFEAYKEEALHEDPGEIIYRFLKGFYDEYAAETFDNYKRRMEDIDELINFSSRFKDAREMLSEVALVTNLDSEMERPEEPVDDALKLSTVHQAKGLEWKVVFIIWMADSMFPSARSLDDAGGEAEERRLFYVATTRAKDDLYLCVPQMRRARDGSTTYLMPSRFIKELPSELLQVMGSGYS